MITPYHIIDEPLPLNQDFRALKEKGLAFIQENMGYEWNNLNTADAGITILDQLCYALTELGYCNDFSIEDILTGVNGKLQVKDQFYLPEEMLTTSPVTINDYIKYLVDGISGLDNALIVPYQNNDPTFNHRMYEVYLAFNPAVRAEDVEGLCMAAFHHLNKRRNLGELFFVPVPLEPAKGFTGGVIEIEKEADLFNILVQVQSAIHGYIFPALTPSGYTQMRDAGQETNAIFNGPMLYNGWVPGAMLPEKKNTIRAFDLESLIRAIPGIVSVSGFGLYNGNKIAVPLLACGTAQLVSIDVKASCENLLSLVCKGVTLSPLQAMSGSTILSKPANDPGASILFGARPDIQADLPIGSYRDINSYYSIQNTFPEAFAVGNDSKTSSSASSFQASLSKQLKGYLTLFDQVLANQFSQLANVNRLFSFKNPVFGSPSDLDSFLAMQDKLDQGRRQEYPVPYMVYSPTYYYQSLYTIPYIQPLLKDTDTFMYSSGPETLKELEEKSWASYRRDPYNAYIHGLMQFMENADVNLERRNALLDHLLARHGEAPLLVDTIINGTIYSGEDLKDKVIIKSLYLQNLGLLSYYRHKAFNYAGANKMIQPVEGKDPLDLPEMDETVYERLMGGDTIDSILNSGKINRIGRLREREFINYSAVELKLSLLLGLRMHYINYIIARYVPQASMVVRTALRQALWFIEKRRGLVMIEMALLLNCFGFQMYLTANTQPETYYQVSGELDYQNAFAIQQALTTANQAALDGYVTSYLDVNGSRYTFARLNEAAGQGSNYTAIDGTTYSLFMDVAPADQKIKRDKPYALELFLPAFMQGFRERSFTDRFHMLMDSSLPVNLDYNYHYVSDEYLPELISSYTLWHESLRYKDNEKEQREDLEKYSDPVKVKELEQERRKQQREQLMLNAKALVATLQKIYN